MTQPAHEQRIATRFKTDFSARVTTENGHSLPASVTNISLSGLQLCCDHCLVKALMSKLAPHTTRNPLRFSLSFTVATPQHRHVPVDIICQQVYLRRLGDDSFLLGAMFETFEHGCEQDLRDHLQHFGVAE
ncbi:MAG: hypothetical protein RPR40_09050 [Bermanella sp.]|jgi:hypothetical protein